MCFVLNWPGMEDLELISGQGTENNIFFFYPCIKCLSYQYQDDQGSLFLPQPPAAGEGAWLCRGVKQGTKELLGVGCEQ